MTPSQLKENCKSVRELDDIIEYALTHPPDAYAWGILLSLINNANFSGSPKSPHHYFPCLKPSPKELEKINLSYADSIQTYIRERKKVLSAKQSARRSRPNQKTKTTRVSGPTPARDNPKRETSPNLPDL